MRAVVQRVKQAAVSVDQRTVGRIDQGLLVLLGIAPEDGQAEVDWLADKLVSLRLFDGEGEGMEQDVREIGGGILLVSQFTLYGSVRKGRRPSFAKAAPAEQAKAWYEAMILALRQRDVAVETGEFQAMMQVSLINDGPVTLVVDTPEG